MRNKTFKINKRKRKRGGVRPSRTKAKSKTYAQELDERTGIAQKAQQERDKVKKEYAALEKSLHLITKKEKTKFKEKLNQTKKKITKIKRDLKQGNFEKNPNRQENLLINLMMEKAKANNLERMTRNPDIVELRQRQVRKDADKLERKKRELTVMHRSKKDHWLKLIALYPQDQRAPYWDAQARYHNVQLGRIAADQDLLPNESAPLYQYGLY
jgi:hypothetical protein